ncbi:MAG: hypothetical protein R3E31_18720 [Chloroflexota bacterium]
MGREGGHGNGRYPLGVPVTTTTPSPSLPGTSTCRIALKPN